MDALAKKLGLKTDPTIFFISAGIMVLFLVALLIAPGPIGEAFGRGGNGSLLTLAGSLFSG